MNIGELDRPDNKPPVLGMPGILARSLGREIDDIYKSSNRGCLADVDLLQRITQACRYVPIGSLSVSTIGLCSVHLSRTAEAELSVQRLQVISPSMWRSESVVAYAACITA